jgi:hypothetical protein
MPSLAIISRVERRVKWLGFSWWMATGINHEGHEGDILVLYMFVKYPRQSTGGAIELG